MRRALALALMLYVFVDFATPIVPGVFDFDPDECVEGTMVTREGVQPVALAAAPLPVTRTASAERHRHRMTRGEAAGPRPTTVARRSLPRVPRSDDRAPTDPAH